MLTGLLRRLWIEPPAAVRPLREMCDAYDVAQHLLNDPARLTTDPRRFARRVADLAGLDADRVTAWLFARCVVEAGDWPYDVTAVAAVLRP